MVKQISAFLENRPGRLAEVTRYLADSGINLLAVSLADTTDFGILRIIASEPDKACEVLRQQELRVKVTQVVAVELMDQPGSLADVLALLNEHHIAIEYMYALSGQSGPFVVLRLSDQEESLKKLENCRISFIEPQGIGQI